MRLTIVLAFIILVAPCFLLACSPALPTQVPTIPPARPVTPTLAPPVPTIVAATATKPAPIPTVTPAAPPAVWVVVANTDGIGVYLRRSPKMEDQVVAWPEGTRLRVVGPDTENEGRRWKQVADPQGRTGWVPAEYTAPAVGP
jgi:hypothetical protein